MIRAFYGSALVLFLLFMAVGFHYLSMDRDGFRQRIGQTVALTGLASPSLNVAWYEPRLRRFEASLNPVYPELLSPERQGFVYGAHYGK